MEMGKGFDIHTAFGIAVIVWTLLDLTVSVSAQNRIYIPGELPTGFTSYDPLTSFTPIDFNTVFIVGSATPNGWNIENAEELVKNPYNPWEFRYIGQLNEGEFKFPVNRNKYWGQDFFLKSSNVLMFLGTTPDSKWNITEQAEYQVTMNIKTMAISITKLNLLVTGTINSTQSNCYHAAQTLAVAGGGTSFLVASGGGATLIAGQKIRFLPGTVVVTGGFMHGYISSTYCGQKSSSFDESETNAEKSESHPEELPILLYPNPTSGLFTLVLPELPEDTNIQMECYNPVGYKVIEQCLVSGAQHIISLDSQAPGIYFLKVIRNGKIEVKKIVKQ
jgi:hypothetical protein